MIVLRADIISLIDILTTAVLLWKRIILTFLDALQLAALLLGKIVVVGEFLGVDSFDQARLEAFTSWIVSIDA